MKLLEEFLQKHHITYCTEGNTHCRPGWIQIHCPFCGDQNFHLGIPITGSIGHCWICGKHSLWEIVRKHTGKSIKIPQELNQQKRNSIEPTPTQRVFIPLETQPLTEQARQYLLIRGFPPDDLALTWGLQSTATWDKYANRIYIPVLDQKQTTTYTTRAIVPGTKAKYLTAPRESSLVNIKDTLYGEWLIPKQCDFVLVVEGPADAWRMGPGTVATYGVSLTEAQKMRLRTYKQIFLFFDNDLPGQRAADLLQEQLHQQHIYRLSLPTGIQDPGEILPEDVPRIWEQIYTQLQKRKI